MEYILIAIATAFNILIIKTKLEKKRYEDAALDAGVLILLSLVFRGSYGGLVVATISSAIISLMFLWNPPKFFSNQLTKSNFIEEFRKKAKRP